MRFCDDADDVPLRLWRRLNHTYYPWLAPYEYMLGTFKLRLFYSVSKQVDTPDFYAS